MSTYTLCLHYVYVFIFWIQLCFVFFKTFFPLLTFPVPTCVWVCNFLLTLSFPHSFYPLLCVIAHPGSCGAGRHRLKHLSTSPFIPQSGSERQESCLNSPTWLLLWWEIELAYAHTVVFLFLFFFIYFNIPPQSMVGLMQSTVQWFAPGPVLCCGHFWNRNNML